jgi:peptidoglycan/LPS O-acetylase OafA/YrhL
LQAWVPAAALSVNLVGWSLSAEAFFYLLLPLVLPRLRAWRHVRSRSCLLALALPASALRSAM